MSLFKIAANVPTTNVWGKVLNHACCMMSAEYFHTCTADFVAKHFN
jgi:hypothetical protein